MNLDNFIKLYTGIPCDFDNQYGTQCMDLAHFYAYICHGIYDKSVLAADCAKNVWLKWKPEWNKYYKKIPNVWDDVTCFPKPGDIIIWNGYYGHIAICVSADGMSFTSFDANYPTGSKPHLQYHDYANVIGWLRRI